ncbi:MAG: VOC family protein [Devosia sp.]|uniref:VOC family protein n=1 Tax=Devosia sp. TaxID=1871048 RepID=UPI0033954F7D
MAETAITVQGVYTSAVVADFEAGIAWYTRFMGRPVDDRPLPDMVQWRNMGGAGLQVWHDPHHAGHSIITVVVPNLVVEKARLSAAGLTLVNEASGDFGGIAQLFDPDGNRINLAEPPKGFVNR